MNLRLAGTHNARVVSPALQNPGVSIYVTICILLPKRCNSCMRPADLLADA